MAVDDEMHLEHCTEKYAREYTGRYLETRKCYKNNVVLRGTQVNEKWVAVFSVGTLV